MLFFLGVRNIRELKGLKVAFNNFVYVPTVHSYGTPRQLSTTQGNVNTPRTPADTVPREVDTVPKEVDTAPKEVYSSEAPDDTTPKEVYSSEAPADTAEKEVYSFEAPAGSSQYAMENKEELPLIEKRNQPKGRGKHSSTAKTSF
ncbi:Hypothetical predicted protein [Mytilus galloprovincialis]|uniref:Uncharacterized protein n=1 Tax=Mytilus galloprovincialis TaxID=29158 RepID=A0A8B6DRG4_MYTGA|nr:Hypothetical predicted protein [Mytilus galloprovincialis]